MLTIGREDNPIELKYQGRPSLYDKWPWEMSSAEWLEKSHLMQKMRDNSVSRGNIAPSGVWIEHKAFLEGGRKDEIRQTLNMAGKGLIDMTPDEADELLWELDSPICHDSVIRWAESHGLEVPESVKSEYKSTELEP